MDGWNTTFLLGMPIFRCYVSFREGKRFIFQVASPQAQLVEYFIGRLEGTADMDSPAAQRQKSVGAVRVLVRMEGPRILGA